LAKADRPPRRIIPRQQLEVIGRSARHPLWWLPDPVANQDESYRRIWQNLRTIYEVSDGRHDTEEWRSHDGHFAMCCVRVPEGALGPEFLDLQQAIGSFPFVRLHPSAFLHIPVQEIGFVVEAPSRRNELSRSQLQEFISSSERPLLDFPRFPILLGPVNSFADAAFLDVHDLGWLSRVHRRVIDFATVPPSTRLPYLPHVTIAHYTGSASAANLAGVLADWRDLMLGEFEVEEIDVVMIDTQETFPELEVVHTFKLGTTRATGSFPIRPDPSMD
jgi:2'-5' RNA ligase